MSNLVHEFDWPDRIVVGTVGMPGARTFYLQVRASAKLLSVSLEKEQSFLLAEKINEILDELMAGTGNPFSVPVSTPIELVDNDPLELPIDEEFRAGAMSLGWDATTAQIVIEAFPAAPEDDDQILLAGAAAKLMVRMPVGTARAFAKRTIEEVGAGRPLCPLCAEPIDAGGHTCTLPDSPW